MVQNGDAACVGGIGRTGREDGKIYESGTAYEFESAVESKKKNGKPSIYVYKKDAPLSPEMVDKEQQARLQLFIHRWFGSEREGYIGSMQRYESEEAFENLFEKQIRAILTGFILDRLQPDSDAALLNIGNPFRGLERFEFEHAQVFFGRDGAIQELSGIYRTLGEKEYQFMMLVGRSGCGKSSLIRSGLLPGLQAEEQAGNVKRWKWCATRPGDGKGNPERALAESICRSIPDEELKDHTIVEQLEAAFKDDMSAATDIIFSLFTYERGRFRKPAEDLAPKCRLIILVDQMEELFTMGFGRDQIAGYVDILAKLSRDRRIVIISTLRSDFYANCLEYETLVEMKKSGMYDLTMPTLVDIAKMVKYPAALTGLVFDRRETGEGLDDVLIGKASTNSNALPLLGYTLQQLYRRRTRDSQGNELLSFKAYDEIGGFEGAIAGVGERTLLSLSPEQQREFDSIILKLVTFDDEEHDRVAGKRESIPESSLKNSDTKGLVDAFVNARLFIIEEGPGSPVIGLSHEVLLQCWPRVAGIIRENREYIRLRDQIAARMKLWTGGNGDESLLLPSGKILKAAEELLFHPMMSGEEELKRYILLSKEKVRRDGRARNLIRITVLTVITALLLVMWQVWGNSLTKDLEVSSQERMVQSIRSENEKLQQKIVNMHSDITPQILNDGKSELLVKYKEDRIVFYSCETGEVADTFLLEEKNSIDDVSYDSGRNLMLVAMTKTLYGFHPCEGREIQKTELPDPILDLKFSADGKKVFILTEGHTIYTADQENIKRFTFFADSGDFMQDIRDELQKENPEFLYDEYKYTKDFHFYAVMYILRTARLGTVSAVRLIDLEEKKTVKSEILKGKVQTSFGFDEDGSRLIFDIGDRFYIWNTK